MNLAICRTCKARHPADSVLICPHCHYDMCPTCGDECPHLLDMPNVGIGKDGFGHSDPYCAMIAPIDSYEYWRGELCEMCLEREDANEA